MKTLIALVLAAVAPTHSHRALKPSIQYTLQVDSTDLSGWNVEIRLRSISDTFRLAMPAHPEYNDRYWRYVTGFSVESRLGEATFTRVDSTIWQVVAPPGPVVVRYRIVLPSMPPQQRGAWQPFLAATGGLFGGPHGFMYLLGSERAMVGVALDLPAGWQIATALDSTSDSHWFTAANAAALMEAPILAGHLRVRRFVEGGVPHRVVYWPLPDAAAFDTTAFVAGIQSIVHQAIALFGRTPYRSYTFLYQDGSYGALEHPSSVTLGAPSADLAKDPHASLAETAHEFTHTWNLMTIRPIEYRDIDYRTQPPVTSLWFSEGLTMFYADLLQRRAGIQPSDSTRTAHLERLISRYLANPAYARFSAEAVSRVAYNAEPGALGDYNASTHLQGELIGTMLDLIVRDATHGRRSMDDVMRLLFERSAHSPGIDGRAIEDAVETVCGCDVTPFFDAHVRGAAPIDFNRYFALIGLTTHVTMGPAINNGQPEPDLRIWGWQPQGEQGVRLIISDPAGLWGRAGLHSRDQLVTINGVAVTTWPELRSKLQSLHIGDTVRVQVRRPTGPYEATVVVAGFERPTVRLETVPNAIAARRALATAWLR